MTEGATGAADERGCGNSNSSIKMFARQPSCDSAWLLQAGKAFSVRQRVFSLLIRGSGSAIVNGWSFARAAESMSTQGGYR